MTYRNDGDKFCLYDTEIGKKYKISQIKLKKETAGRMEMLGMTKGALLTVINKKHSGSAIIKVRGTRFALGKNFARGIIVESAA